MERYTFVIAYMNVAQLRSDQDTKFILDVKQAFTKPLAQVREMLHNIDNECSHINHLKSRGMEDDLVSIEIFKLGHPLPCSSSMCNRGLWAASVHYPILRKLLHNMYIARYQK